MKKALRDSGFAARHKITAIVVLSLLFALPVGAQTGDDFYPSWTMSAMGGVNYVSSDGWIQGLSKGISPNFQLGVEYPVLPWLAVRGVAGGMMAKYPVNPYREHQFAGNINYIQLGADAMFDFSNMSDYRYSRVANPYAFLGAGVVDRFKTADVDNYIGPAIRTGIGSKFRLGEFFKLLLEAQYQVLGNRFNTFDDNNVLGGLCDDNIALLLGVQYDLGAGRRQAREDARERQIAAARAAQAAAAQATADRIAAARAAAERESAERRARREAEEAARNPRAVQETIVFGDYEYTVPARENGKLRHIVTVLNQYPEAVLTLNGYSDEESESQMPDRQLSKLRLDAVIKFLTDAGVEESRITVNNYGFEKPESNAYTHSRLVICITE